MNSIGCLIGKAKPILLQYGAILRLDLDTFLTPQFTKWWPIDKLYTGRGAYTHGLHTAAKLKFLSEEMGMKHLARGHNIGSTWYGPAEEVVAVGELSVEIGRYLIEVEFAHQPCYWFRQSVDADFANSSCETSAEYGWSLGFYPGVITMYSGELAINHLYTLANKTLPGKSFSKQNPKTPALDCNTIHIQSVCDTAVLHTFHNDNMFSKFAFEAGHYDKVNVRKVCFLITLLST